MADSPSRRGSVAETCPECGTYTARHLIDVSKDAFVNFYDCAICHHLWSVEKRDPSKVSHLSRIRSGATEEIAR